MSLSNSYKFLSKKYLKIRNTFKPLKIEICRRKSTVQTTNLKTYEINIKTCGSLYEEWRKENKFPSVPKGDLDFKISYVDTNRDSASKLDGSHPVVLALHGAPGSYSDFSSLISFLHQKGARVVAPSFPDFTVCNPSIFRHTAEEKAQLVKDFLQAISIPQVDALIVHSATAFPGLQLCVDNNPKIRSLVLLNPGVHTYEMKGTRHIEVMRMMAAASEHPFLLKLLHYVGPLIFDLIKSPLRFENVLHPLLSVFAMVHGNIPQAKENFLLLSKRSFPMLYIFSDDDKLIGKEVSYDLAHLLGASDSDIQIYDKLGKIKQKGNEKSTLRIMSFENGSHYMFWKYAEIVNPAVEEFIRKSLS